MDRAKARTSRDPQTAEEFGDGALMNQGYTVLWMGWQWDVPDGQMRMNMPIATDDGKPITGLVRGNFIPNDNSPAQPLADRNHRAYPIDNPASPDNFMTVRNGRRIRQSSSRVRSGISWAKEARQPAAQEVLHGLIEEELQIQGARIRQRHHEAGQGAFGAPYRPFSGELRYTYQDGDLKVQQSAGAKNLIKEANNDAGLN